MREADKNKEKPAKYMRIEKNMIWFTVFAVVLGICLAIGCTKMIIPTFFLTSYGVVLIIAGLLIIMFDDKLKKRK